MKFYSQRIIVAILAFIVGICSVWAWLSESRTPDLKQNPATENSTVFRNIELKQKQLQSSPELNVKSKPQQIKPVPINQHENFKDVVLALKRLSGFKNKKGLQTFYISKVRYNEGEYAYAHWKQDNSIIILHFPFYGEPSESQLYWLDSKARIDLKNVVPTGKYENLGCCLVEKDWAEKVLSWCKSGYRLKFTVK